MTKNKLKTGKIIEIARRIVLSRKEGKPLFEKDYHELIEQFQKLDTDSTKLLVEVIVDSIKNSMADYPVKNNLSQSLASHLDSLNSKIKYSPKIREGKLPVRYFGADWDMKELTIKTKHPLHYIFFIESGNNILHAFNNYHEVEEALRQDVISDMVRDEINKLGALEFEKNEPLQTHSGLIHPLGCWGVGPDGRPMYFPDCNGQPQQQQDYRISDAKRPDNKALFFEHINYGGEVLELEPGYCYQNLLDKWLHWFGFIMTDDWNDNISSIKTGDGTLIVFEHVFGGGASLTIRGSIPIPHFKSAKSSLGHPYIYIDYWVYNRRELPRLDLAGWNDRISSVYHYK